MSLSRVYKAMCRLLSRRPPVQALRAGWASLLVNAWAALAAEELEVHVLDRVDRRLEGVLVHRSHHHAGQAGYPEVRVREVASTREYLMGCIQED